ncbi:hypothetical protein FIM03_01395 [SAR202 cluster bacterium AD-802-L14_MRT_200m]|nr:hypothetical protein [SAR202 cluster bacterium AD-802-L14_MRT_200m]
MKNTSVDMYEYRSDSANSSLRILLVRNIVGFPIALVMGFAGSIVNGLVVPSAAAGDFSAFAVRMFVIGAACSTGAMIAWFNMFESRRGGLLVWSVGTLGGFLGGIIAFQVGSGIVDNPDIVLSGKVLGYWTLSQRLIQVVILGAGLGTCLFVSTLSLFSNRFNNL